MKVKLDDTTGKKSQSVGGAILALLATIAMAVLEYVLYGWLVWIVAPYATEGAWTPTYWAAVAVVVLGRLARDVAFTPTKKA